MPGIVIERPKMTKTMYQALKKHIQREREKKKQEQEHGKALERLREERALRQKKAQEDHSNLEQLSKQLQELQSKLEQLKAEKHDMFSQLKKILAQEEECRKKVSQKEKNEINLTQYPGSGTMYLQGPSHVQQHTRYMTQGGHGGRPLMPTGMKRQRSPSPPPRSAPYSGYPGRHPAAVSYPSAIISKAENYSTPPPASKAYSSPLTYISQSGHTYQASSQPGIQSHLPTAVVGPMDRGGAGAAQYPGGQFSAFPGHYASPQQQQQQQQQNLDMYAQARASPHQSPYPHPRMPQPTRGGMVPGVAASYPLALQQQLEHASHQSGFSTEDRQKAAQQQRRRDATMASGQQPSPQQAAQHKGGITSGFPVRTQPTSSSYQPQPQHRGGY